MAIPFNYTPSANTASAPPPTSAGGGAVPFNYVPGAAPAATPPAPTPAPVSKPILGPIGDLAAGAQKGVETTELGIGGLGNKIQQGLADLFHTIGNHIGVPINFSPSAAGQTSPFNPNSAAGQKAQEMATPTNTTQAIGKGAEQLGEYFLPAAHAAKAEDLVNILSKGISSPFVASAARIAGKTAVQAAAAGAVKLTQTGGNLGAAASAAAGAGLTRGALATIGEGAQAIKLPERLYSTIFRNTASDMMSELKSETIANLKQTNPYKYASLLKAGIINEGPNGPIVNETIAKQALDGGLKGSIRNMARAVITGTLDSEHAVRTIAQNYAGTVNLSEPQFVNVLNGIQNRYQDVGFNEISDEAGRLARAIKQGGGQVDAQTALDVRRLLDKARIASSFDVPAEKLSLGQANLKTLADTARTRVNALPGMGDAMKKYSFYIDAMDTLAKEAARRGNNQALSLIDSLFLSGAFGAHSPLPGLTGGIARKVLMSGPGTTYLAQLLNKSGGALSPAASGALGAATSLLPGSPPQQ